MVQNMSELKMRSKSNYQTREETRRKVLEIIQDHSRRNVHKLPSERELSIVTGGSRGTIREILDELQALGIVSKNGYGRELPLVARPIPVIFSAVGDNMVSNATWAKLWHTFVSRAPEFGIYPELILSGWPAEKSVAATQKIQESSARYAIFTDTLQLHRDNGFDLNSKQVLGVDEAEAEFFHWTVCLDNREAGHMAGDALFQAGFRHLAVMGDDVVGGYLPFLLRNQGFAETCRKHGLAFDAAVDCFTFGSVSFKKRLFACVEAVETIRRNGYDGLFVNSDEMVPLIYELLEDSGVNFKGDFGLITVNAQNKSEFGRVKFSTISHATTEVALKLLKLIRDREDGKNVESGIFRMKPTFHTGVTLK